jgi:outer membrane protein assembly factor BamB
MSHTSRSIAWMVGCTVLFGSALACGQDWPQWRGMNRDGKLSGFTAPAAWPETLTPKWKTKVGLGDATPALVDQRLYVFARQGGDEVTLCLDADTGKELWRDTHPAAAISGPSAHDHPGPRSSPTVLEGKVVTLGVTGTLSCLDASSGKLAWRNDVFPKNVPQFYTAMSPIVVDGTCIAHLGGKDKAAVIAFDLAGGSPKWRWDGDGPAYASPVLMTVEGTKQMVAQTDRNVVGLEVADGKLLWKVDARSQGRFFNSATPIVAGQTVIFTGQGRGTKAVKVEKQGDGWTTSALWTNEKLGTGFNTPVLKDDMLFGVSDRGNFFCMSAKDGQTAWIDTAGRDRFAAVLDAGPVILALLGNADLIAFQPSAAKYEQAARLKAAATKTYTHPVIAGKRIYVKDLDSVAMSLLE